ncbi:MAG TPA: hypothetical protein PK189_11800, partial [bacterium]|nr:hypothetical protein [bacterium]
MKKEAKIFLFGNLIINIVFIFIVFYLIATFFSSLQISKLFYYLKNFFVIIFIFQFLFSFSLYFAFLKYSNKNLLHYLFILILQFIIMLLPFISIIKTANINNDEMLNILLVFIFCLIGVSIINNFFEINFFDFVSNNIDKLKSFENAKIIICLKNYLIFLVCIIIFVILFLNDVLFFFVNKKFQYFEVNLFYIFFSFSVIFLLRYYFLFSHIISEKSSYFFLLFISYILLYALINIALKTPDYYKYIYSLVIASTIELFLLYVWTHLLKIPYKFHYKNYWKILVVFLAYFTFTEYFTYKNIYAEIIIRIFYFLSLFLSIYLCQCYTLDEEKEIKRAI